MNRMNFQGFEYLNEPFILFYIQIKNILEVFYLNLEVDSQLISEFKESQRFQVFHLFSKVWNFSQVSGRDQMLHRLDQSRHLLFFSWLRRSSQVLKNLWLLLTFRSNLWRFNSKVPDVPELAHQDIFQLSRLSFNCYAKTVRKNRPYLNLTDFMRTLSVIRPHFHRLCRICHNGHVKPWMFRHLRVKLCFYE